MVWSINTCLLVVLPHWIRDNKSHLLVVFFSIIFFPTSVDSNLTILDKRLNYEFISGRREFCNLFANTRWQISSLSP